MSERCLFKRLSSSRSIPTHHSPLRSCKLLLEVLLDNLLEGRDYGRPEQTGEKWNIAADVDLDRIDANIRGTARAGHEDGVAVLRPVDLINHSPKARIHILHRLFERLAGFRLGAAMFDRELDQRHS